MQNQNLEQKETEIIQALAVCAELTNTQFSAVAFDVLVDDLMGYELQAVKTALNRCRRELTGRLTLAAILERLPLGLPSADAAFGQLIESWQNENLTVVVPEIAQLAAGMGAYALWQQKDKTGARMAFKQEYERLAQQEIEKGVVQWAVSAGADRQQFEFAINQAVKDGKLTKNQAVNYLPSNIEIQVLMIENANASPTQKKQEQKNRECLQRLLDLIASKSLKFPSLEEIEKAEKAEFERKKTNCLQSLQNL